MTLFFILWPFQAAPPHATDSFAAYAFTPSRPLDNEYNNTRGCLKALRLSQYNWNNRSVFREPVGSMTPRQQRSLQFNTNFPCAAQYCSLLCKSLKIACANWTPNPNPETIWRKWELTFLDYFHFLIKTENRLFNGSVLCWLFIENKAVFLFVGLNEGWLQPEVRGVTGVTNFHFYLQIFYADFETNVLVAICTAPF